MQQEACIEASPGQEASSPDAVRMSLAAAMTLGLKPGRFYRGAELKCINLLETYPQGCSASCAYCGLAHDRVAPRSCSSFIRVSWPTYSLDLVVEQMKKRRSAYDRVCVSMITRKRATQDLIEIVMRLRQSLDVPISALLTPTCVDRSALERLRDAGVDRIGIAVDAATSGLFDVLRGREVRGPHVWDRYWQGLAEAVEVFGEYMAGCHLIVGLGESEKDMVATMWRVRTIGCVTHLFSFFPEAGSRLDDRSPPPIGQYRRLQLARYLIDEGWASIETMKFDEQEKIYDFGVNASFLDEVIASGEPFRTSGCPGADGKIVACNRPFANCRPGPQLRNYPFPLEAEDVRAVRSELWS